MNNLTDCMLAEGRTKEQVDMQMDETDDIQVNSRA
jgi:hypothetical protein